MTFQCQHPECTRSYKRREHLLRHQKAHANLRSFGCQLCPAAFNRRYDVNPNENPRHSAEDVLTYFYSDLLNRHIALSHSISLGKLEYTPQANFLISEPERDIGNHVEAKPDDERRELALRRLSDSMMISLGSEIADASNRKLLEQRYFSKLHLHWPILHQNTFHSKDQPEQLVQAVLVAGLWVTGTAKERQLAESHHDKIVEIQCENSVKATLSNVPSLHRPQN